MHPLRACSLALLVVAASACARPATSTAVRPSSVPAAGGNLAPGTPLTGAQRRWVDSVMATLTLRQRVGQMVQVWVLGDYVHERSESFAELRKWIVEDEVGGATMSLGSPIEVAAKLNALQRLARVPLLISSDLEPGLGRLQGGIFVPYLMTGGSATVLPNAMAIGAADSDSLAFEAGRIVGREARAVGIQVAFGPVVDVNNSPANPVINTRSFGENPQAVGRLAAAFVRGIQHEGVAATAKHFPGHGDTDTDSHHALPVVTADRARLDTVELVPFRAAIEAGVSTVMTAHIALPAIEPDSTPATLAPAIITELLRDTLGFGGVTYTDALTMEAVGQGYPVERSTVLAVKAGNDILLKPSHITRAIDAVVAAVESGEITAARIDTSVRRILELKARTGVAFRPMVSLDTLRATVGAPEHWAVAHAIAARAVTLLRDEPARVPLDQTKGVAVVVYAPDVELTAGRAFTSELRAAGITGPVLRITPATTAAQLDSLTTTLRRANRVVLATYVRRVEGEGRVAIAPQVASWVDTLASGGNLVVVALGNPYVIRQFPQVRSYLVTYGIGDALERAAARAVAGRAPIGGRAPISLPGFFRRGDGLTRPATVLGGAAQ